MSAVWVASTSRNRQGCHGQGEAAANKLPRTPAFGEMQSSTYNEGPYQIDATPRREGSKQTRDPSCLLAMLRKHYTQLRCTLCCRTCLFETDPGHATSTRLETDLGYAMASQCMNALFLFSARYRATPAISIPCIALDGERNLTNTCAGAKKEEKKNGDRSRKRGSREQQRGCS